MSQTQQDNHIYKDLVVKSCTGLDEIEKQELKNLGPLDRFIFIINDTTEGATIPSKAFSIYYSNDQDLKTIFYEKCYEIRITSSKITNIGSAAFRGIDGKSFECLTCVKIVAPNLTKIEISAFQHLKSKNNQFVSLDLSACTSLTTISETAFGDNSFYMLKLPSSITSIKSSAFGCYNYNPQYLICLDETTSNLYTEYESAAFQYRQLIGTQALNTDLGIDNLQITDGIIYGFTPETIKMIVDNPTSHFTLKLKDPTIKRIEYNALDLEYKYGLPNISMDIDIKIDDPKKDTVKRNYISARFTLAALDPDFKTILESDHTYNDCTFYIAQSSPTGEITKIIDSSVPGESAIIIPGLEFTQEATLKHCVIQYNASVEEAMNVAKLYKNNSIWTIESSSGTKKTLAEYMSYLDIKLGSTPTYDNIAKYAWPLIDNFTCSEPFDFTPSESNKLKYTPFDASKLTEASISDMANLTSGNATYVPPETAVDIATLNISTPGAYVRFMNLETYDVRGTKNIKLHSVQPNIAENYIYILQCPKENWASEEQIGFEINEFDNNGVVNTTLKLKAFDFTINRDHVKFKTVCCIEGLSKSLTESWSIEADFILIKNLNIDYMQFINAKKPQTNIVTKISSANNKLTFQGASSERPKTLMFTNLYNVDMSVINTYATTDENTKKIFNVDGLTIIN